MEAGPGRIAPPVACEEDGASQGQRQDATALPARSHGGEQAHQALRHPLPLRIRNHRCICLLRSPLGASPKVT